MEDKRLTLTIEEAAVLAGVSRNLAYRLARQDKFPGVKKLGEKRMVISKAIFEKWLQGSEKATD